MKERYAPAATAQGVALSNAIAASELFAVCDRNGVQQVLVNFLSNAFKFTENGEVMIYAFRTSTSELVRGTFLEGKLLPHAGIQPVCYNSLLASPPPLGASTHRHAPEKEVAIVAIANSGRGIPKENVEEVFDC